MEFPSSLFRLVLPPSHVEQQMISCKSIGWSACPNILKREEFYKTTLSYRGDGRNVVMEGCEGATAT